MKKFTGHREPNARQLHDTHTHTSSLLKRGFCEDLCPNHLRTSGTYKKSTATTMLPVFQPFAYSDENATEAQSVLNFFFFFRPLSYTR